MIGAFNVSRGHVTELIHLSKFPGTRDTQLYIIRAHRTGLISEVLQLNDPHSLLEVTLDVRGYDIFSSYPLRGFVTRSEPPLTIWLANLGLIAKMAAPATIVYTNMTMMENGSIVVETRLKALGVLGQSTIILS